MAEVRIPLSRSDFRSYQPGDLSVFPVSLDDEVYLHAAVNGAVTLLQGYVGLMSKTIYVVDNSAFPDQGIVRVNDEQIYYSKRDGKTFSELIRGFNGSRIMAHNEGGVVIGCVSSLHHNSVRDAIVKCQLKAGLVTDPPTMSGSLTSRVKFLDAKWFDPLSKFCSFPTKGPAPLTVNFKSLALGEPFVSYMWDFGDGGGSSEKDPSHVYSKPGIYNVTLSVRSTDGKASNLTKKGYVKVLDKFSVSDVLAYARDPISKRMLQLDQDGTPNYVNAAPLAVELVDQTLGDVRGRRWNFGDGSDVVESTNGYDNVVLHRYTAPGVYWPELFVTDQNMTERPYRFKSPIVVGRSGITVADFRRRVGETSFVRPRLGVGGQIIDSDDMVV